MAADPGPVANPYGKHDTLPDREARNPYLRFVLHLGAPLSVSLVIHALVLSATGLVTFAAFTRPTGLAEYEAGIRPIDVSGEFRFGASEALTTPAPDELSLDDLLLTQVNPTDIRFDDVSPDASFNAGDLGIGAGTGGGLLGTGSGAGEAGTGGFGSGFGGRPTMPTAGVWNLNVAANRVVYVVDFSGSIITVVEDLKRELKRSVGRLNRSQSFNVILFYGKGRSFTESFQADLTPATGDAKQRFISWIDERGPEGGTNPLPAVERALRQSPEAIFFFSDGLFDEELVDRITAANRRTEAQFVCLLFDDQVFADVSGLPQAINQQAQRLKRLAERNTGRADSAAFKIVTLQDLYAG